MKSTNTSCLFSLLGLSMATSPFIIFLLTVSLLTEITIELGKSAEELFRPERLPILNFPQSDRE